MIFNVDFEQGSTSSDSLYYVRSGFIRANPTGKVVVSATSTTGKALQAELDGYADTDSNYIFYLRYYDVPYTFNTARYISSRYLKVVLRYKDGSKLTPEEIENCTLEVQYPWYIGENGDLHGFDMPYAPAKPVKQPFPSTLWRVSGDDLKHEACPESPEKAVKKPFPSALWRIDYISPNMPYHKLMPNVRAFRMRSMPRENVIRVYDYREPQNGFKHNGEAILAPSECTEYHELNGRWDVELTHPVDEWGRWKTILPQNVLKIDGQLFRIDEHTSVSDNDGIYIKVHAKHISYDLADELIGEYTGENLNGMEFIRAVFASRYPDVDYTSQKYNFQYNSDIENRTGTVEFANISVLNALIGDDNGFINQLGGEIYRDNFYFSINSRMEGAKDNAFALKYGFDMVGITQKIDYSELATWILVQDNYGNGNWIAYVDKIHPIHHHKQTYRKLNYSSNPPDSMNRILRDSQDIFGQIFRPKVSYEVNMASMKNDPKYSGFLDLQNYRLGDSGTIECELLDIKTTQEIFAVEFDRMTGDVKKIKLGNQVGSLIRPAYKANTVSKGSSPAETALQKQVEELGFREYITTPITTVDGLYLATFDNKFLIYKG